MLKNNNFEHPEWGTIRVCVNRRARRIIMRADEDGIRVTVPPYATYKDIERALAIHGDKLKEIQTRKVNFIDHQYRKGEGRFRIEIQEYKADMFMWVHNEGTATLMCPEGTDYGSKQEWLRKAITNIIHEEARRSLPQRLELLAEKHGFKYSNCSVRNSHSRWGSCSRDGRLRYFWKLIQCAPELIDYVIIHELAHTLVFDHSASFWKKVCKMEPDFQVLRQRLRVFSKKIELI